MGRFVGWRALLLCGVASVFMVFGVPSALADDFHGIAFTKQCASPVKIGAAYTCAVQILNVVDIPAHDTLRVTDFSDKVHSAGGDVSSGPLLETTGLVFTGAVSCTGGSGAGTDADPYLGAAECLLPFGTSIQSKPFSYYTVQANDFNLPNNRLADTATLNWNDTCNSSSPNCTTDPQSPTTGASALVLKLESATATDIHNAQHTVVTAVAVGTTVHDFVTVTGQPGAPVPTGNVNVDWFLNGDCSGAPAVNSGSVGPLDGTGHFDATAFAFTVNSAGFRAFRAHYEGDPTYLPSDGACEPLRVVDANIQITPNGVNRVGQTHTFTAHVNVNDGTGSANAVGALVTFTIDSGPGTLSNGNVSATSCSTNASGNCTIDLTSAVTGVTIVSAHTTVLVAGVSLTRNTNGIGANSGPAAKRWVDARIHITPSATNRVGAPHTFTAFVEKDLGMGAGWEPAGSEPVSITLTNSNGAVASPTGPFNGTTDAGGHFAATFTSATPGQVSGHASSSLNLGSLQDPIVVQTNGQSGSGSDAVKTFVDARIHITPDATNRVGANHTFTAFVEKNLGLGGGWVAAAGEPTSITLTNSNGAVASPAGPFNGTTDAGGHFAATFTSATPGQVTGHASSTLNLGSAQDPIVVQTNAQAGNGPDAVKTFVDARIHITPFATNRVGENHTFTAFVEKNLGLGGGWVAAAGEPTSITLTNSNGAAANPSTPLSGTTDAGGHFAVTFTSATPGQVTGHASSSLNLGSAQDPIVVQTNGQGLNGADAVKTFVDARIHITPSATNEVGQPHTFTAFLEKNLGLGAGWVAAAGESVSISLTNSNGAAANPSTPLSGTTTAGGLFAVTFTSATPGQVTGHASSTLNLGAVSGPFTVQTNGQSGSGSDAVKTFVDANIQITPNGVNRVGDTHTFTAHVNVNNGTGFVSAPDGTQISFTKDSGPVEATFTSANPCTTSGGTGSCTITLTSPVTGVATVSAHSTLAVGGVSLTRNTNGTGANSGPATKQFVNAKIEIAPNATNEVGAPHVFTVTLSKDTGGGYVAAAGEHVDFTLSDSSGAVSALNAAASTCDNAGANTNASGQCTIEFTSNAAGKVTGHASSTLVVDGKSVTVETDGVAPNSGNAVKTFVDANIQIAPLTDTNPVSTNHTLTGHVNINKGAGAGYENAPAGTVLSFALTNSGGASAAFVGPASCTVATGGSCSVVISSSTAGTTTVKASTTVVVEGVSLTRSTGDAKLGDSADASKLWADATARTDILNAQGAVILTAVAGTVVHDKVFVARSAGTPAAVPNPSGSVVFHRFATINCTGTAVNQTVALTAGNPSVAESDTFAVTADMSYQAEYLGDANYPARTGACEPLTVTPLPQPAIAIVKNPKSQTVAVGGTATFTITVTNTGNVTLTDVNVVDPLSPLCNRTKADIPALASMAPAATVTYTCTRPNVRAAFDNVATATGTPPTGPNVTASDTAPVTTKAVVVKKKVVKKKPKVVSHKKPKATG